MTATISQRNREIKKELKKIYENVLVQGSRGTAYGWVNIKVFIPTPADHIHNLNEFGRCRSCWDNGRVEESKIRNIAHEVAKKIGSYIGSYYSDDGYDTERDTMIIEVQYIDPVKKIEMTPADEGKAAVLKELSQATCSYCKKEKAIIGHGVCKTCYHLLR